MFDKWLNLPAHYYLKITALLILIIGICLHNTLMSIGVIWIGANWLIEAKYAEYWIRFKNAPAVWLLLLILLLSFLSLLWSEDLSYGLKDLGKKAPLFVIPFVLGTSEPVEKKVLHFLLYVFLGVLALSSFINYYRFNYVLENAIDIRDMSYFVSHVRFSILTSMAVFVGIYLLIQKSGNRILWMLLIAWFTFYTFKSQILNGYIIYAVLALITTVYLILRIQSSVIKKSLIVLFVAVPILVVWQVNKTFSSFYHQCEMSLEDLDKKTDGGRYYMHELNSTTRENGHLVWLYVQQEELENEWNRRSEIAYDSLDRSGQPMFGTLMRYLTSKEVRKDSVGVWSLSEKEINEIENGRTSIATNRGVKAKMQEFYYQYEAYQSDEDPNGHSILQRIEHLKVAWSIISKNWLTGVGIGDVHLSFQAEYDLLESKLTEDNRHRSHNQFLTIWISHGLLGLILLFGFIVMPFIKRKRIGYFQILVTVTLVVSFLFQDMIETHAGVTIFALFYGLSAFLEDENQLSIPESHQ
jgi:hypothetical protein